jgi:hypothetical protein
MRGGGIAFPVELCHPRHAISRLSKHIAISPITLLCPRCGADAGKVCELLHGEIEVVHIERIKAALKLDEAARAAIIVDKNSSQR